LGATLHTPLKRYSENLYRIRQAHTLHAVIYNSASMIEYVLKNFDNHAWIGKKHIIDVFYAYVVQPAFNCFAVSPIVASQRSGMSDITGKEVDYYQEIIDSYKKFAK
jgi:hypothetical protein